MPRRCTVRWSTRASVGRCRAPYLQRAPYPCAADRRDVHAERRRARRREAMDAARARLAARDRRHGEIAPGTAARVGQAVDDGAVASLADVRDALEEADATGGSGMRCILPVGMQSLPIGKLRAGTLQAILDKHHSKDPRVVVGPRVGEDAAIIDNGDRYLVATTDPIAFATAEIGRYALHVNPH